MRRPTSRHCSPSLGLYLGQSDASAANQSRGSEAEVSGNVIGLAQGGARDRSLWPADERVRLIEAALSVGFDADMTASASIGCLLT